MRNMVLNHISSISC